MIQLNPDCLIFRTSDGENIPCSAELVTLELIGQAAELLDPELIQNASAAVLHYFKVELNREFVSVAEFSEALEKVLRGFGLAIQPAEKETPRTTVEEADLRDLAAHSGKGFELVFFHELRDEMRRKLEKSPEVLRFKGLRGCVKQLAGAQRWSQRCQTLNDQIVDYLRTCLIAESNHRACSLIVV